MKCGRERSPPKPGQAAPRLKSSMQCKSKELKAVRPPPDELWWPPGSHGPGGTVVLPFPFTVQLREARLSLSFATTHCESSRLS